MAFLVGDTPVLEGYDQAFIEKLLEKLLALGAKNVVLTGVSFQQDKLGFAMSDGKTVRYDFNDRIDRLSHGTGDVYASVFAGALLRGKSIFDSAALAADIVCSSILATPKEHWYGVCFEQALPEFIRALEK